MTRPDLQNIEDVTDGAPDGHTEDVVDFDGLEMFAIFDDDDLADDCPDPWAMFRTDGECEGLLKLIGDAGCTTPVIRPVILHGKILPSKKPAPAETP